MPKPVTPLLTADTIIENQGKIILIERKYAPPGFAIPGGFVDVGESVEQAAIREAREETGLDVHLKALLGVYSNPARDPRGHNVCTVFVASAEGTPVAGDDAGAVHHFDINEPLPELAFDHATILADYKAYLSSGKTPDPATMLARL